VNRSLGTAPDPAFTGNQDGQPINAFVTGNRSKDVVRQLDRGRSSLEGFSSEREHFIPHQVKANPSGLEAVKIERLDGLFDVPSQLLPSVTLREDAFGQALGAKPAVRFLRHFEHNFVHLVIRNTREGMRTW